MNVSPQRLSPSLPFLKAISSRASQAWNQNTTINSSTNSAQPRLVSYPSLPKLTLHPIASGVEEWILRRRQYSYISFVDSAVAGIRGGCSCCGGGRGNCEDEDGGIRRGKHIICWGRERRRVRIKRSGKMRGVISVERRRRFELR